MTRQLMTRPLRLVLLFILCAPVLHAQRTAHFLKVHEAEALNKQIHMFGYEFGYHRISFSLCGGMAKGTDAQFLSPDQLEDSRAKQRISSSLTVTPTMRPSHTYLERCNSTYSGQQLRLGFSLYLRKNDSLSRAPFSGPHIGVEAVYMRATESQTVTYKSETSESRYVYSGIHKYSEVGAATHLGWQFALFREKAYVDFRAVLPFYYPFMVEPNINSPFSGNKYEAQISIGWKFSKVKPVTDDPKELIRQKI